MFVEVAELNVVAKTKNNVYKKEIRGLTLLARDYFQLVKMVGKFIGHCLNFPSIYTGEQ